MSAHQIFSSSLGVILSVAAVCAQASSDAPAESAARSPSVRAFGDALWKVIESYPSDGTHTYHWPKKGSWAGVTQDLEYAGVTVAKGDPKGRCYCCGLTFEVFLRAWQGWAASEDGGGRSAKDASIPGLPGAAEMKAFRSRWFGADGNRHTMQNAIVTAGIGVAIESLEDARPGDFVQIWRQGGSGHAVVFHNWDRGEDGEILGIRYWSTQKSTNGIGLNSERFGAKHGVDRKQVYIARVGRADPPESVRCAWLEIEDWPLHDVEERSRLDALLRARPDLIAFRSRVDAARAVALGAQFGAHRLVALSSTVSVLLDPLALRVKPGGGGEKGLFESVSSHGPVTGLSLVVGRKDAEGLAAKFGDAACRGVRPLKRGRAGGCVWLDVCDGK